MIDVSVLIPAKNASQAIAVQLPHLLTTLEMLRKSFEIIVVDDHSSTGEIEELVKLLQEVPSLRILRLDNSHGASAAISAGLAEARGREVLTVPAGGQYSGEEVVRLFKALARADFVHARPQFHGLAKSWQRIRRIPRWLLLGLQIREPNCSFWSARNEALAGIQLARGMYRYLPTLVAMRGYRVAEVPVRRLPNPHLLGDARPNPGDLLCAWWLRRRWRNYAVEELGLPTREVVDLFEAGNPASSVPDSANRSQPFRKLSA